MFWCVSNAVALQTRFMMNQNRQIQRGMIMHSVYFVPRIAAKDSVADGKDLPLSWFGHELTLRENGSLTRMRRGSV
ncbi:hypothetical protein ZHAS_00020199 [Anopheles sinensis]|uniref:Uncharacterized protein n=1 Tax=Anopheles sinensis TaxID=74873 RepID=A0A084WP65_ANOSI|nr:hypothetical protein ZHAS_00020199 [Anopheles sinensis]